MPASSRGITSADRSRPRCWRPPTSAAGSGSLSASASRHVELDAVRGGVPLRRFDARRVVVDGEHRREARAARPRSRARRSRSRRRAGSRARARRAARGRAASSRAPPVPNARPGSTTIASASGRRRLPGRPDPEPPDAHRPVKVAPALLPVRRHVVGRAPRRRPPRAAPRPRRRCTRPARGRRRARSPRSPAGRARASARAPPRRARSGLTRRRGGAGSAERALQLLEEPLVRLVGLVGGAALELLEQALLLLGQPARHLRRSRARAGRRGRSPAAPASRLPRSTCSVSRLRAGLELELELAVQRRHL